MDLILLKLSFIVQIKVGKKGKEITGKDFIKKITPTYSENNPQKVVKYTYTIKNSYLNKKTKIFYVEVIDKNGSDCSLKTYFRIMASKKRYKPDYAPRIKNFSLDGSKLTFIAKDMAGTKTLKLYDLNGSSPSKVVYQNTKILAKGGENVNVKLNKFTQKDGKYKIKIVSVDNASAKLKATRVINFAVETKAVETNIIENNENVQGTSIILHGGLEKDDKKKDTYYLMIDNVHYDFADIEAEIISSDGIKAKDLFWKIENESRRQKQLRKIAVFKSNNDLSVSGKNKVRVNGIGFDETGKTKITVYVKGEAKAICYLKVITSSKNNYPSEGDVRQKDQFSSAIFYLTKDRKSWGKNYVEAYINNAAKIISDEKNDSKFHDEARKKYIYGHIQNGLVIKYNESLNQMTVKSNSIHRQADGVQSGEFKEIKKTKKQGELSANNYLILFTSKNQWMYLLKKEKNDENKRWNQDTNRWVLVNSGISSAGNWRDHFEQYCTYKFNSQYGASMRYQLGESYVKNGTNMGKGIGTCNHLIHSCHINVYNVYGRPTSHGCVHAGTYSDKNAKLYYQIMEEASVCTRFVMF